MDHAPALSMTYCGPPPLPAQLWTRWNLDPLLIGALALAGLAFWLLRRHATSSERWTFAGGMAVLAVAFVSPLCALTVALFSARVAHHVLLVALAAPLLAWGLRSSFSSRLPLVTLITPLFVLHTVVFWLWHAPDAYAWALSNSAVYWLMQTTLLGTAMLLWAAIFSPASGRGRTLAVLLGTTIQMGMLGALLVFAGRPLYAPHVGATLAYGFDPLADQQLAGLLMWVPASVPYLAVALVQLARWLLPAEARRQ